jgi:NAD(P)-dependent dehydrogenase (short-subunit alcohol dehydrogenase family)
MDEDGREFEGRTILVTGAGKGIGRATAVLLAQRGGRVVAFGRAVAVLVSLAAVTGSRSVLVALADLEATRAAVRGAGQIDLVVNCAGTTALDPFVELTLETFDHIMTVNAKAPLVIAQEYVRARLAAGRPGAIVNVSSDAAFLGVPDHAAYCASKAALDALTRVMANELGKSGIRVNSVNPNITLTDMARKAWSDPAKSAPRLARIPRGRFLEPEEIAEAVAFLLSDRASAITGASLRADGGFSVS